MWRDQPRFERTCEIKRGRSIPSSFKLTLSNGASLPSTNTLTSALLVSLFFKSYPPLPPLRWFWLAPIPTSSSPKKKEEEEAWIRGGMTTCSPVAEDEIE